MKLLLLYMRTIWTQNELKLPVLPNKKYYADHRKYSMARAVALRFLHEVLLTDKWDHLFKQAGLKVTKKTISWGPVDVSEGKVDAFSQNRLPRLVAPDFIIRTEETNSTLSPDFPDCKCFRFFGKDKNDSIRVAVKGSGAVWLPAGLQVFLLSDYRPRNKILVTDYLPV